MPGFWIWHSCIWKGYSEFRICLIMAPCPSVIPEYALVCPYVPQYTWKWLNIDVCPWICLKMLKLFKLCLNCFDYARVLNMPWYYYYNYITIIVIILLQLEFFLTTMASELSKYLNEQLGVFLNVKQQRLRAHLFLNLCLAAYIHGNTMLREYCICDR